MLKQLSLIQPDDWHLHLRDGELLKQVLPYTSRHFRRAIIMPNLDKPVTRTLDAQAYRQRILRALPAGHAFEPLMTLYLTEHTEATDVESGFLEGTVSAVKLYPAGATTNSASGVRTLEKTFPVLSVMQKIGMPLLIHGEVVDTDVDIFDREAVFIERTLIPLRQHFPELKIVFEHITTAEGVDYVQSANDFIAATITPHHLVINRNALFQGGIRPDYYCLPIAKREQHRKALCEVATSGHSRFFLGTDSAPHFSHAKHSACGCAGIFNAANAIGVVTQVFENAQALDKLEGFLSKNGANFYGLPVNEQRIVLKRSDAPLSLNPAQLEMAEGKLSIFDPMMAIYWQVSD